MIQKTPRWYAEALYALALTSPPETAAVLREAGHDLIQLSGQLQLTLHLLQTEMETTEALLHEQDVGDDCEMMDAETSFLLRRQAH